MFFWGPKASTHLQIHCKSFYKVKFWPRCGQECSGRLPSCKGPIQWISFLAGFISHEDFLKQWNIMELRILPGRASDRQSEAQPPIWQQTHSIDMLLSSFVILLEVSYEFKFSMFVNDSPLFCIVEICFDMFCNIYVLICFDMFCMLTFIFF